MDNSTKKKNIYDLEYQTVLNYLNIVLVGLLGGLLTIFFQTGLSIQDKILITGATINLVIITMTIFFIVGSEIKKKIKKLR